MDRLPSEEERQWLINALKRILGRRSGEDLLSAVPLVEPTDEWFPEPWAQTAAHGHRLAQRLMYYAGLDDLEISLNAYQAVWTGDENEPWDSRTAGWFAGIHKGRAHFGLQVRQFRDPEVAAGVLAHEVAHAWRNQHNLVVEDRDKEELLTDVTTIALGFGILTTNVTDRYRSSGDWSRTTWSISSGGYLPPQSMAYLLALWCLARDVDGESKAIARHLEPNQLSYFRAAIEELEQNESTARELLHLVDVARMEPQREPDAFTPRDPSPDEIEEPPKPAERDALMNRGKTVYQRARREVGLTAGLVAFLVLMLTWLIALSINDSNMALDLLIAAVIATAVSVYAARRARRPACAACGIHLNDPSSSTCPGCGGTIGRYVTIRELQRIREEEMDRRAAESIEYEDCDECLPEEPCAKHAPTFRIGPEEPTAEEPRTARRSISPRIAGPQPRKENHFLRKLGIGAAVAVFLAAAFAWWRQNHVRVFFDNALPAAVTVSVDGSSFTIKGRPPVERTFAPGHHQVVVAANDHEIERYDAVIEQQSLYYALAKPRFYVYSVAAAGAYKRMEMVYAQYVQDRKRTDTLIVLQRWFAQNDVDFLFTQPPEKLASSIGPVARSSFEIVDLPSRELARALNDDGRKADAIAVLQRAIHNTPCDSGLRNDLIDLFAASSELDKSRNEAKSWVAACDSSLDAHRTYQDQFRAIAKGELLSTYQQRVRQQSTAANHYLCGRLLNGQNAVNEFRTALQLDPAIPWAKIALGRQLLEAEQDAEAYSTLSEIMREPHVEGIAAIYFAMAAVATNKVDEALTHLPTEQQTDEDSLFHARWILARARKDWREARLLLTGYEKGEPTPETIVLRARLDRDSGKGAPTIGEELTRNEPHVDAVQLRFEDALENARFNEAATMDISSLRATGEAAGLDDIYACEAALLAHLPDAPTRCESVRGRLTSRPELNAILDAAAGRISSDVVMRAVADEALTLAPHAWFALAIHAATTGQDAKPLFRKAAARSLEREFPYRVALRLAGSDER